MPITTVERESPQSNEGREKHENTIRKHDQSWRKQKNLNQFLCGFCVVRDFFSHALQVSQVD